MYKLNKPIVGQEVSSAIRLDDGTCFPFVVGNKDYDDYLKWLEAGNTPEPADEAIQ